MYVSAAVAGLAGAFASSILSGAAFAGGALTLKGPGEPLGAFIAAFVGIELGHLVSGRTKLDILITPVVTIVTGALIGLWVGPPISKFMTAVGALINWATVQQPLLMGILVSVLVGIALTLPISSAAICAALGLTGLAGGAAVAGCSAQMVGFAVASFKENKWGGLVSQGIGTSMLQMGNIVKNPRIWIAPTLASAITGPIATCIFKLEMNGAAVNSGMGTCGLCGPIGVWTGWVAPSAAAAAQGAVAITPTAVDWLGLLLICVVLPSLLSWLFGALLRKAGWIKDGDLTL